jgi:hypothetical protein
MLNGFWKLGISGAIATLCGAFAVSGVWAADPAAQPQAKFRTGDSVIIGANETVPHDLYAAASTIRVDGRVEGDLVAAGSTVDISGPILGDLYVGGGTVTVSGPVSGDVFVAGGTVSIGGPVGRHVRVAGGNVTISNNVEFDLMAGAGTFAVGPRSRIGGDVMFSAGDVQLDGSVVGGVLGQATQYERTGAIGGAEQVQLTASREREAPVRRPTNWALAALRRYVGILLVGTLLLALAPRLVLATTGQIRRRPLPSLGIGALSVVGFIPVLIAVLIAMVLLVIPLAMLGLGRVVLTVIVGTLVGSAALTFAFLLIFLFVAATLVGSALGASGLERTGRAVRGERFIALAIGVLVVVLMTALPLIGWLAQLVVVCLGLGALVQVFRGSRRAAGPTVKSDPVNAVFS